MSLAINTRRSGDVSILDLSGRITLGEGASALRNAIRTMALEGHKKFSSTLAMPPMSIARALACWFRASPR